MSGHSARRSFYNVAALFILTWVSSDTASAACPAHPGRLAMTSTPFAAVFCEILHKSQNRLSQCHLGVQHDLCTFGTSAPTPSS